MRGLAVVLLLSLPVSAPAQTTRYTATGDGEPLLADPGGTRVGRLNRGASLAAGPAQRGFVPVTLDGWVFARSVKRPAAPQGGHDLQLSVAAAEENLRAAPNGPVAARLANGTWLDQVARRGGWVHVRRALWVAAPAARAPAVAARAAPSADSAAPAAGGEAGDSSGGAVDPRRGVTIHQLRLYRVPDGPAAAILAPGTTVRVTSRAGGWARVETQGWVRESEIRPADTGILTGVSAAELRATPDEFKGKLLRWTIQYVALQTADELRPDFQPGQKYILARGPAPEYAFVYIAVPDSLLDRIEHTAPLASLEIVAKVLTGRSTYLANPVLELRDIL